MKVMLLEKISNLDENVNPLLFKDSPEPVPSDNELLIRVSACGVCHTELDEIEGRTSPPVLPVVPGHQVVGRVEALGSRSSRFEPGDRIGVAWIYSACGRCGYCQSERENLCADFKATGRDVNGGYAEYTVADERFCFPLPEVYSDLQAAPLLCAGLIGYRSLRAAGDATRLGLYGFGAAAHIITQIAMHQGRQVFAFTKPGDMAGQQFAQALGAVWASPSDEPPPEQLDAAIIFAPIGPLVPAALRAVVKGGTVVCAGIHMSEIPAFPYDILWGERAVRSVANLTRADGEEFFATAPEVPVKTSVQPYRLADANTALHDLREGRVEGAAVLAVDPSVPV